MMQKLDKLTQSQRISFKIQLIKQISYPRRKKSPLRSQLLKAASPKIIMPKVNNINTEAAYRSDKQQVCTKIMIANSQIMLKKTNLQFNKLRKNTSLENPSLTVQHWNPPKPVIGFGRRNFVKESRQQQVLSKPLNTLPQEVIQKKIQPRDGQSILRKSSLFLLNFLKSKQKRSSKIPQIGDIPILFEKIKKQKIPYDDIKTQRQQRQRKFIQSLKAMKSHKSSRKTQQNEVLLYPQPW